ncbi:hypothetical protein G7046_g988 [Stylonectria norvegica]|nr:hypothetical protein G7046_g988 [Stylonectria norvegica]
MSTPRFPGENRRNLYLSSASACDWNAGGRWAAHALNLLRPSSPAGGIVLRHLGGVASHHQPCFRISTATSDCPVSPAPGPGPVSVPSPSHNNIHPSHLPSNNGTVVTTTTGITNTKPNAPPAATHPVRPPSHADDAPPGNPTFHRKLPRRCHELPLWRRPRFFARLGLGNTAERGAVPSGLSCMTLGQQEEGEHVRLPSMLPRLRGSRESPVCEVDEADQDGPGSARGKGPRGLPFIFQSFQEDLPGTASSDSSSQGQTFNHARRELPRPSSIRPRGNHVVGLVGANGRVPICATWVPERGRSFVALCFCVLCSVVLCALFWRLTGLVCLRHLFDTHPNSNVSVAS